jgi:hypothetical protein
LILIALSEHLWQVREGRESGADDKRVDNQSPWERERFPRSVLIRLQEGILEHDSLLGRGISALRVFH